jgi:6-phosphogluconolactonase
MKADVRVFKDKDVLSRATARLFVEFASEAVEKRGKFFIAMSGGSTPGELYRLLAAEDFRNRMSWEKTIVFWGDERCVSPDDPDSNYFQAQKVLLGRVPIPDENIWRIKGELEPAQASNDYAQTLKRFAAPGSNWPRFDLALLGMGEDGHTASLFPGSPVEMTEPTLVVTADYQGRPALRVTLTPLVFNSARVIVFLVAGESKATTLKDVLSNHYRPEIFPSQRIRPADGSVIWMVDEAAASRLRS